MTGFSRTLQLQDHTRRYSIAITDVGWEVREERDSQVVRQTRLQDWHRVERAHRSIANEVEELRIKGWSDVQ